MFNFSADEKVFAAHHSLESIKNSHGVKSGPHCSKA